MCVVDWVALGTWVQAVAVVAAAIVALVQLNRFVENERVSNTLAYMRQYTADSHDIPGGPYTAFSAANHLLNEGAMTEFARLSGMLRQPGFAATEDATKYERFMNAAVVVYNYFDEAGDLYERNLVDHDLFLSRLSLQMLDVYVSARPVFDALFPPTFDLRSFKNLLHGAQRYRRQKGNVEVNLIEAPI